MEIKGTFFVIDDCFRAFYIAHSSRVIETIISDLEVWTGDIFFLLNLFIDSKVQSIYEKQS
jgi:hypothetical protein